MTEAVYCSCASEPLANAILTHLRSSGFGQEISVFLKNRSDTKDISLNENAIRDAGIVSIVGALVALMIPGLGPVLAIGPLVTILSGAAAGGAVGGLIGGTGAFKPLNLPDDVASHLHQEVENGNILISVHSDKPARLELALMIFSVEGATDIHDSRKRAA
jgi:hypothetical protein